MAKNWGKSDNPDNEGLLEEELVDFGSENPQQSFREAEVIDPDQISCFTFLLYFLGLKKRPEFIYEEEEVVENETVWPEYRSNIFSRLVFSWFGSLLLLGFYKPLQHHHLWKMYATDSAQYIRDRFFTNWDKYNPSLLATLHHSFGWKFYAAAIPKVIYDCLQFVAPYLLGKIIEFLGEDPNSEDSHSIWYGLGIVAIFISAYVLSTLLINIYFHINFRTGLHVGFLFFLFS